MALRDNRQQVVLVGMILANSIILVDQTAVPLALPAIQSQFGVGTQVAQWVLNLSLLTLSGFLILGGRFGDQFGQRRIFLIGAIAFGAGSALGGAAPTFSVLLCARVVQGLGGSLMLPGTVAIVRARFPASARGEALGTMGGIAAIAGALGPTIGGALTSAVSWRFVFFVNVPLAVACLVVTLRAVPRDPKGNGGVHVDFLGAALLCVAVVGLVFGLTECENESVVSPFVLVPIIGAVVGAAAFFAWEWRCPDPLMDLRLFRRTGNYLGATISQALAGFVEMGLGLVFPLLLILDLGMSPVFAGLALIPATMPMIFLSTSVGKWYDRSGGKSPLVVGFGALAASGIALVLGVHFLEPNAGGYLVLLPGLVLFGTGLALVLTVDDPVSLDSVGGLFAGQVSGVSATAEQAGGAVGIAILYAIFHGVYTHRLDAITHYGTSGGLSAKQGAQLRQALQAAEQTGLSPHHFDQSLVRYLDPAFDASKLGYGAVFAVVAGVSILGAFCAAQLVSRPVPVSDGLTPSS